jgi:hypothetical protein
MFRPKIRGSLLDALEQMAAQAGRDANEILEELLVQATSNDPPPVPSPTSRAGEPAAARRARHDAINAAAGREDGTPESSMAALKKREANDRAEGDGDDAPPEKMKGGKPNPLRLWAGKDDPSSAEQKKADERARLRQKYENARGRSGR